METKKLTPLRNRIDEIDSLLIGLLDERASIARAIGEIKKTNNLAVLDKSREKIVLEKTSVAKNDFFVKNVFGKILESSRKLQEELK
jgi:chorismate mutase / prephenate dehydratase